LARTVAEFSRVPRSSLAKGGHVTATILLIRHAAHAHLGRILSGRTPSIPLSIEGVAQADALAARLSREPLTAIHASPVQRAQETAHAIATPLRLDVQTVPALNEVDFGDWTGRAFADLEGDEAWSVWNTDRATAMAPNGETMIAAQERAWAHVEQTALAASGRTIAMVSHCDIIRALVARVLGLSLDHYGRIDIDPASVTRIVVGDWGAKIASMNETER
jgi:probable phosphoglycerate mutase